MKNSLPFQKQNGKKKFKLTYKSRLQRKTDKPKFEGIEIDSICHHSNSPQNNPINSTKDWDIYQLIDGTDAKKANQLALKALNNGATALCIENPNDLPLL